jgi:hypothetical protein
MKITDMKLDSIQKLNKVTESRYGFKIDYSKMTGLKAKKMLATVNETINSVRRSHGIHSAEKNPKYMELLMIREGLTSWVKSNRRKVMESEVGQAEAILAAKDMVDSLQDMLEKIGKMSIEQLPALTDTIRDQIGSEQAVQFKTTVGQTLAGLMDQLNQARDGMDNAARALAGENADMSMGMPGAEAGSELDLGMGADPMATGGEMGADPAAGSEDEFAATDAAAGGPEDIGREMR